MGFTGIAIRIVLVYLYALTLLRLTGKRTIHALSPLDFTVAAIVGDLFDDVFLGEIPVSQGLAGLTTIVFLHLLVTYADSRSRWLDHLLGSGQTLLIRNGRILDEGMRHARMSRDELLSALRVHGLDGPAQVSEGSIEPSGQVSILRLEDAKPVERRDLPRVREALR